MGGAEGNVNPEVATVGGGTGAEEFKFAGKQE